MPIYIFLYISVIVCLFYSAYIYFKVYKSVSAYFLFLSLSFFWIWLSLYLVSFTTTYNPDILVYLSRWMFTTSIIWLYWFLGFLYFSDMKIQQTIQKNIYKISCICIILFTLLWVISNGVIYEMSYSVEQSRYYESYGSIYILFVLLYLLFFPIFLFLSYTKIGKIRRIEKIRLKYLTVSFWFFVFLWIILQVILPLYWIILFEKEIVLLLLPFLMSFWYTHNRYYFSDISVSIWKIWIYLFSLFFSFFIIYHFHEYVQKLPLIYKNFWNMWSDTYILEFFAWVIFHTCIYKVLLLYMLPHWKNGLLVQWLSSLREQIPRITSKRALNTFLQQYFKHNFHIFHIKIKTDISSFHPELLDYFSSWISRDVFINDTLFIENNKNKFNNYEKLWAIPKSTYLIFPWYDKQGSVNMFLELWKKELGNAFTQEEITSLKYFIDFLQGHLQYISVYKWIQDLSINLDKRVDEKTIEYNNLLSKQKEFIAYVGHEIKNPITNTLFLSDSIRQDIEWKVDADIQEDANILYDELIKVSKLVKYIFSAEKFDLDKAKLYKNTISLSKFMKDELHYFQHNYMNINFSWNIQDWIIHEIDEIQFRQVIQNLVNNSIKFTASKQSKISLSLSQKDDTVLIEVQDNGKWFSSSEVESVFDKYVTWSWNATWLGMWLYLCKKIIELHGGTISTSHSQTLWWANFTIRL